MAANSTPDDAADKRVFDVAKPGKTAPDATGRPVIVGHGAMIPDPMMKPDPLTSQDMMPNEPPAAATARVERVVVPPVSPAPSATPAAPAPTPATAASVLPVSAPEKTPAPASSTPAGLNTPPPAAPKPPVSESSNDEPDISDAAAVDELADQAAKKKEQNNQDDASKAKAEAIQKLIDEKTYFVSIGKTKGQRSMLKISLFVLVVVAVLAAGAWFGMNQLA